MRLYLTGADGMLGTALTEVIRADPALSDWSVLGVSLSDFDIADREMLTRSIDTFAPDVVVHTAACAIVDDCEADPRHALRANVSGTHNVAGACRRTGSRLIYLSSDYVFDGVDPPAGGYRETDTPNPLSIYGLTKLAGERISATVSNHLVVRTSWLFGGADERTDNVLAMVRRAARGERSTLIHDQFSRPTYTVDLARALVALVVDTATGTVHVTNAGIASWHEVCEKALAAFDEEQASRLPPDPIAMQDCTFLGARPPNSTLNTDRMADLGVTMPSWSDAVCRFCAGLATELAMSGPATGLSRP